MKQISVDEIITELRKGGLESPSRLSNYLVILSASLYTAGKFETENEVAYLKKWAEIKEKGDYTDKMTDALAKQTDEYRLYKKAKVANVAILETIRALKKKLQNLNVEYQEGQNY